MKKPIHLPETADEMYALIDEVRELREARNARLSQAAFAATLSFAILAAGVFLRTDALVWAQALVLVGSVVLLVHGLRLRSKALDIDATLKKFTPKEWMYGPSEDRKVVVVNKSELSPETARKIDVLTTEGIRLWWKRRYRANHGLFAASIGLMLLALAFWFGSSPLALAALVASILAGGLLIDSVRVQRKINRIDSQMRSLDPTAPLIAQWPEELERKVLAALNTHGPAETGTKGHRE